MHAHLPLIEHAPLAGVFVLLMLGGLGLPFPEDVTLIATGALIANGTVHLMPAIIVVYTGILAADLLLYRMGRTVGRTVVSHRRFRRILPQEQLANLENRFNRNSFLFVLAGRHLIGLRPQVFLVSGIMRMPIGRFLAADALSALLSVALMIGIGYAGGNSLDVFRKDMSRIEHAAVVAAAAAAIIFVAARHFRSKRSKDNDTRPA